MINCYVVNKLVSAVMKGDKLDEIKMINWEKQHKKIWLLMIIVKNGVNNAK